MIFLMLATALAAPAQESPSLGSLLRNPRAEVRLTCRGEEVTDVVQPGEDYDGTSERDVVVVLGPGGEIWTSLGDDLICVYGASRADPRYGHGAHIVAGPGHDTVITYGGSNTILAGDGDDLIYLNGDIESVEAGEGNDHIWALGATVAYIYGEGGDDLIIGSPGNDGLYGEDGNDFILGAPGFDTIDGGVGYDTCYDTATGANFIDCEVLLPHPGLPEAGGAIALGPARLPSATPRPAPVAGRQAFSGAMSAAFGGGDRTGQCSRINRVLEAFREADRTLRRESPEHVVAAQAAHGAFFHNSATTTSATRRTEAADSPVA